LVYEGEAIDTYPVTWRYSNYAVQNTLYLPLPDIINRIRSGNIIPRISPLQG